MSPVKCFTGDMLPDNVRKELDKAEDKFKAIPIEIPSWTGPRPPTMAQAEIVELPKPRRADRFTITREELQVMERVAWNLKISKQNVGRELIDLAESAIKTAKQVRGE